jgi:hypothetical protein
MACLRDMSTQPAKIASIPVALSEADCFFEANLWAKLRESNRSHEEILSSIGMEARGGFVHTAREAARSGNQEARQRVIEYDIEDNLLARFKAALISGKLIATGFHSGAPQRNSIASELWTELRPDFIRNTASSKTYQFTRVEVAVTSQPRVVASDLEVWLRRRIDEGQTQKKILAVEAQKHFGIVPPQRTFNQLYKKILDLPPGRPPKRPKK